ncbi:hypothetical protein, partial [Bradyrhizobium sp. UFLA05-112]
TPQIVSRWFPFLGDPSQILDLALNLLQYAILTQLGPWISDSVRLKRDEIRMNHHRALGCCLSMISAQTRSAFAAGENRVALCANAALRVRIML